MKREVDSMTLREMQKHQPWKVPYKFRVPLIGYEERELMGRHALFHAQKSVGKIAAVYEKTDHKGGCPSDADIRKIEDMAADLFAIAIRLANLYEFDLCVRVEARAIEKNGSGYAAELEDCDCQKS